MELKEVVIVCEATIQAGKSLKGYMSVGLANWTS